MTVSTIYANSGDGEVNCASSVSYNTARTGAGTLTADSTSTITIVGQRKSGSTFTIWESFFDFDTSSIPDSDAISDVDLMIDGVSNGSTTDFTMQARTYDWGGTLTTADYREGDTFNSLTLLATYNSASYSSLYMTFTENGTNFQSAINKTGTTSIVIGSDRLASNTEPTTSEHITLSTTEAGGTSLDPKLVITHDASTTPVSTTGIVNIENLLTISQSGISNIEGLLNLNISGVENIEYSLNMSGTGILNVENLTSTNITGQSNIENLLGINASNILNLENLLNLTGSYILNLDNSLGVNLTNIINVENLGTISQSGENNLEYLNNLVISGVTNIDFNTYLLTSAIINLENNLGISLSQVENLESLSNLSLGYVEPLEWTGQISGQGVLSIEGQLGVIKQLLTNIENLGSILPLNIFVIYWDEIAGQFVLRNEKYIITIKDDANINIQKNHNIEIKDDFSTIINKSHIINIFRRDI